jgi:hypothetical protein
MGNKEYTYIFSHKRSGVDVIIEARNVKGAWVQLKEIVKDIDEFKMVERQ